MGESKSVARRYNRRALPVPYCDLIREMKNTYNHRSRPKARHPSRRPLPPFGAARLKREFDLVPRHNSIQRISRGSGLSV